jgi:CHAD domain-containing protein
MKASRLIAKQLREVEEHEAKVPDEDAVHETRVAARRLRAGLFLLHLRALDGAVKALQDALGAVRDLQLQADWLRERDETLARARERQLRRAEQLLGGVLQRWRAQAVPALLEAAAHARTPGAKRVRKIVRKRLRRLEGRLEQARTRPTASSFHRARIAVKQVRYLVEVGKGRLPSTMTSILADLKTLQTSLGQLHDADVRIALLEGRPLLLREQRDTRRRLAKIVAAQLARWDKQQIAARAVKQLR